MQRHLRVPDFITEWSMLNLHHESGEQLTASKLVFMVIEFCNLRASMSSLEEFTYSSAIVSSALKLDSALDGWAAQNTYVYNIIPLETSSCSVFGDYYHTYSSTFTASCWNNYRSVRTLLNELLLVQLEYLTRTAIESPPTDETDSNDSQMLCSDTTSCPLSVSKLRSLMLRSRSVLTQLTQDICASVPFYLYDTTAPALPPLQHPRAALGNILMWSLYTAACTFMVSDIMQQWVRQQLENISDTMGIKQARALAILLRLGRDPPAWNATELLQMEPEGEKVDDW